MVIFSMQVCSVSDLWVISLPCKSSSLCKCRETKRINPTFILQLQQTITMGLFHLWISVERHGCVFQHAWEVLQNKSFYHFIFFAKAVCNMYALLFFVSETCSHLSNIRHCHSVSHICSPIRHALFILLQNMPCFNRSFIVGMSCATIKHTTV